MTVRILSAPVRSIKQQMARRRQVRAALHMLSASGVLRSGHVELRYTVPLNRKRLGHNLPNRTTQLQASE
ncbi:MAG: hypothetical protein GDA67_06030 [Nitrospira sp. CR1.3]|nr:hypothetical protein [Nitrospira sp. CR1.3]